MAEVERLLADSPAGQAAVEEIRELAGRLSTGLSESSPAVADRCAASGDRRGGSAARRETDAGSRSGRASRSSGNSVRLIAGGSRDDHGGGAPRSLRSAERSVGRVGLRVSDEYSLREGLQEGDQFKGFDVPLIADRADGMQRDAEGNELFSPFATKLGDVRLRDATEEGMIREPAFRQRLPQRRIAAPSPASPAGDVSRATGGESMPAN